MHRKYICFCSCIRPLFSCLRFDCVVVCVSLSPSPRNEKCVPAVVHRKIEILPFFYFSPPLSLFFSLSFGPSFISLLVSKLFVSSIL